MKYAALIYMVFIQVLRRYLKRSLNRSMEVYLVTVVGIRIYCYRCLRKSLNTRPEVINNSTYELLLEFLAFRHVVRNNYTHKLEPDKVRKLVENLDDCYKSLKNDLTIFCQFLDEMDSHS